MFRRFLSYIWKKKSLSTKLAQVCSEIKHLRKSSDQYTTKCKTVHSRMTLTLLAILIPLIICSYALMNESHFLILCSVSFVVFPSCYLVFANFLTKYYTSLIARSVSKCEELEVLRQELINLIMETETYKNVHDILSTYAPERLVVHFKSENEVFEQKPVENCTEIATQTKPPETNELSSRHLIQPAIEFNKIVGSPINILPRPIVSANPGLFGRLLDYALCDGPHNRLALICSNCYTHNGMALSDDFGTLIYQCYFCRTRNYLGNVELDNENVRNSAEKDCEDVKDEVSELKEESTEESVVSKLSDDVACNGDEGVFIHKVKA